VNMIVQGQGVPLDLSLLVIDENRRNIEPVERLIIVPGENLIDSADGIIESEQNGSDFIFARPVDMTLDEFVQVSIGDTGQLADPVQLESAGLDDFGKRIRKLPGSTGLILYHWFSVN